MDSPADPLTTACHDATDEYRQDFIMVSRISIADEDFLK
jgi:hypothetical protein